MCTESCYQSYKHLPQDHMDDEDKNYDTAGSAYAKRRERNGDGYTPYIRNDPVGGKLKEQELRTVINKGDYYYLFHGNRADKKDVSKVMILEINQYERYSLDDENVEIVEPSVGIIQVVKENQAFRDWISRREKKLGLKVVHFDTVAEQDEYISESTLLGPNLEFVISEGSVHLMCTISSKLRSKALHNM